MPTPILTPGAISEIDKKIDLIFDKVIARLLGHGFTGKSLFVSVDPDQTLPGIFAQAATQEGGTIEPYILNGIAAIAKNYIIKNREEAKAKMHHTANALLADLHNGRVTSDEFRNVLDTSFLKMWDTITSNVQRVVATENNNAAIMGQKEGLDQVAGSFGIEDPVYCFICVHDRFLCDECLRLHCLNDERTPRAWYSSEISSEYHKKGEPTPSWGDLHPNGRCWPSVILPGFGFDINGHVTWVAGNFSEIDYQRHGPGDPGVMARREWAASKLGKTEAGFSLPIEDLNKFDVTYRDLSQALSHFGWREDRATGHVIWKNPNIPTARPLAIKHDHAGGSKKINDEMLRQHYLKQAGLQMGRQGQIEPSGRHPYATEYKKMGFDIQEKPAQEAAPAVKTWTPSSTPTGMKSVPIGDLEMGPVQDWRKMLYRAHFANGHHDKIPHVTAGVIDGKLMVDQGSDVVAAAKEHGMTHVPVMVA